MIESFEAIDPLQQLLNQILTSTVIVVAALLAGLFVEHIVLLWLYKLAQRTRWGGDNLFIRILRKGTTTFWFILLGLYLAMRGIDININALDISWSVHGIELSSRHLDIVSNVLLVVFIISSTTALARFLVGLFALSRRDTHQYALSIFDNILKIVIYLVGFIIVLSIFSIDITPLIAAVGVSGLAVSLALQETLTNLFSGLQIILSNQINPGDYIKLSSGEEGYVTDINWRTTKLRQLANNMVIIPNSKLTSAIVTNFDTPMKELSILFDVGVSYESDLERVEEITIEVAKEVMQEVAGGVPSNDPFIRYNAFNDFSINFTVILRGDEFVSQYLIKHEFVKRLHRRYHQEGIVIPFPIRTVQLTPPAAALQQDAATADSPNPLSLNKQAAGEAGETP